MMPMDCTLNKDIIDCFERHVAATYSMKESTPAKKTTKFSASTPKRIAAAMRRLYNPELSNGLPNKDPTAGACTSARIIQDVDKFLVNTKKIYEA